MEVVDVLKGLTDWIGVAIQLGFDSEAIEMIKNDYRTMEDQRRQMIMDWLRKFSTASWKKLREALMKCDQSVLAERIPVTPQIVTCQSSQHANMIRSNEDKIKDLFAGLLVQLRSALESEDVSVDDICHYLDEICECNVPRTDFIEIFKVVRITNRWNYVNYGPLENFVKRFLPSRKELVIEYKKAFSGFCTTTKLIDYIQIHSANLPDAEDDESTDDINKLPLTAYKQKDFRRLKTKLKVERKISELSLKYVQDFWIEFAEEFDLPFLTAVIDSILEGCLEIVWLLLPHVAAIIAKSAHKSAPFFRRNHIFYVSIDDHPLYDARLTVSHVLQCIGNSLISCMTFLCFRNNSLKPLLRVAGKE